MYSRPDLAFCIHCLNGLKHIFSILSPAPFVPRNNFKSSAHTPNTVYLNCENIENLIRLRHICGNPIRFALSKNSPDTIWMWQKKKKALGWQSEGMTVSIQDVICPIFSCTPYPNPYIKLGTT